MTASRTNDPTPIRTVHEVGRLTVVHVPLPHARTAALAFGTRSGAVHDPEGLEGLAHLAEHMIFRNAVGAQDRADDAGVDLNAYTGSDLMVLEASSAPEALASGAEAFAAILSDRTVDARALAAERSVVLEEMAVDDQSDDDVLDAALHPGHPYARPTIGTERSVRRLRRGHLSAWRTSAFPSEGAHLVVAGRIDLGAVLEAAGRIEPHLSDGGWEPTPRALFAPVVTEDRGGHGHSTASITIAWDHDETDLRRSAARDVVIGALADGPRSPLTRRLRDELGLCYSVSIGGGRRMACSTRHVRFETRAERHRQAVEELLRAVSRAPLLVDAGAIARSVATERLDRLRTLENPARLCDDLVRALCEDRPDDDVLQAVSEDLSLEEVMAEAEALSRAPYALVSIL